MTDVMDESVSWEQRRELRRKKRQELLAEADRLAQTSDTSATRSSHDRMDVGDDDDFENERQKRRRERDERRRKEREELEKQVKDEEEQRAERDRRREERRRQREGLECGDGPVESYTSSTTITKTVETHDDRDNHEEITEVVVETTEVIEEEYPVQNGHSSDDEQAEEEEIDQEKGSLEEEEEDDDSEPQVETEETYTKSVSPVTIKKQARSSPPPDAEADTDEVKQRLNEIKLKREQSGRKKFAVTDDGFDGEEHEAKLKQLAEKRRMREQKQREEEEREREEAAKREAEYQEQLRIEREERERRRADAEAKRQEYRKQLTEDQDAGSSPLHPKNLTSPLVSKVEQLNKHITESPKSTKASPVQHVGKLDSRLEKYTKQASKQEVKKTSGTPGRVAHDVTDRRNRWERGDVISSDKATAKKGAVATSADISSRKNLWESGKVGSPSVKSSKKTDEVKGAGLSTRKDQWLKVTQQEGATKKSETPVAMKTGVMNRLNRWEKGEVAGASPSDKAKAKTNLPASGVGDRRAKWENIGADSPKSSAAQKKTNVIVTTDVSDRKNRFESSAPSQQKHEPEEEEAYVAARVVDDEPEQQDEQEESQDRHSEESDEEEGISLHSSDEGSEDLGEDESYAYDDE